MQSQSHQRLREDMYLNLVCPVLQVVAFESSLLGRASSHCVQPEEFQCLIMPLLKHQVSFLHCPVGSRCGICEGVALECEVLVRCSLINCVEFPSSESESDSKSGSESVVSLPRRRLRRLGGLLSSLSSFSLSLSFFLWLFNNRLYNRLIV